LEKLEPIDDLAGVSVKIVQNEVGRETFRARVQIDETGASFTALEIIDMLAEGEPAIFTRDYHANVGHFDIAARPLLPGDTEAYEEIARVCAKENFALEPTGGIDLKNFREIIDMALAAGVPKVIPHVYSSIIDQATGETRIDDVKALYDMMKQVGKKYH